MSTTTKRRSTATRAKEAAKAPAVNARAAEIFGAQPSIFTGRARVSTSALQKGVGEMVRRVYATVPSVAPLDPRHPQIKLTYIGDQACARYSWARAKGGKLSVAGCINLPAMGEPGDMVPRVIADQYTGYSLHEMSHFLFTPLGEFSSAINVLSARHGVSGDFAKGIVNALEDVAIERELIRSGYAPGAGVMLRGLVEKSVADVPASAFGTIKAFPVTLAFALRGYTDKTAPMVEALPAPLREIFDYAASAMRDLPARIVGQSGAMAGVVAIADETLRRLVLLREPPPDSGKGDDKGEPGDDGEQPSDGEPGDGEPGDTAGDGDGEPGDDEGGEGSDDDGDVMGEPGGSPAGGRDPFKGEPMPAQPKDATPDKQPEPAPQPEPADKGDGENVPTKDEGSDKESKLDARDLQGSPISTDMQPEQAGEPGSGASGLDNDALRIVTAAPANDHWTEQERQNITKALASSAKVAHSLRALLDTSARDSREGGKRSGRLDAGAFARIATGAETVFERREYRDGSDAAITILVDRSSSMCGHRIEQARTLAGALSKIVGACAGVRCEILGFHSGGGGRANYGDANTMAEGIASEIGSTEDQQEIAAIRGDCCVTVYKQFNESHGLAVSRLASMWGSGGTPDTAALTYAVQRLSKQTAGMKILIYLADGEGSPDHVLARVIQRAERSGLVLIGVGIDAELNGAFSHRCNVRDVAKLGESGLGALLGVLAKGETAQAIGAGGDD